MKVGSSLQPVFEDDAWPLQALSGLGWEPLLGAGMGPASCCAHLWVGSQRPPRASEAQTQYPLRHPQLHLQQAGPEPQLALQGERQARQQGCVSWGLWLLPRKMGGLVLASEPAQ